MTADTRSRKRSKYVWGASNRIGYRAKVPLFRAESIFAQIILLVTVCLAAVGAAAGVSGAAATRTQVIAHVTPFEAGGGLRKDLHIAYQRTGTCEPGSDVLPNDVYRCTAGNGIYDPCWRDYRSRKLAVVCLGQPWSHSVVRLVLTANPGRSSRGTATLPWGIQLDSGARCIAVQGAHDTVTGKGGGAVLDYSCGNDLYLLRGVNRTRPLWTIRAAHCLPRRRPCSILGPQPISIVWFGGNNPFGGAR